MPGLAVFYLVVHPPHNAAVAAGEHFFSFKMSVGIGSKKFLPVAAHIRGTLKSTAVWCWRGVLEDTVFGHGLHDSINVMAIEGHIKPLYSGDGGGSILFGC